MLAVNPRTTWTWPQQSPSPSSNPTTKRKKDGENTANATNTRFSDQKASCGNTTESETCSQNSVVIVGIVGRKTFLSAGTVFHDQSTCDPVTLDDAEPAFKISRTANLSDCKLSHNATNICKDVNEKSFKPNSIAFAKNSNTNTHSSANQVSRRKMWLKRKKKSMPQNLPGEKSHPTVYSNPFFKPKDTNPSVSNNIDSSEIVERNGYHFDAISNGTISNGFPTFHKFDKGMQVGQETSSPNNNSSVLNNCEGDKCAKNRLLDIVLTNTVEAATDDCQHDNICAMQPEDNHISPVLSNMNNSANFPVRFFHQFTSTHHTSIPPMTHPNIP